MKNDFFDFPAISKADWIAQVKKDLKGKDFEQALKSHLWGRISLDPFYTREDLGGSLPHQYSFHPESEVPGESVRIWQNITSVLPGDTSAQVLDALQNGSEGLVLHLTGLEDLDQLLEGVLPQYIPIAIRPMGNPVTALKSYFDWVDRQSAPLDRIQGALLWSPSDLVFDQNEAFGLGLEVLEEIFEMTEPYPQFKAFALQASRYTESGANPIDGTIFILGELIEILDQSTQKPDFIFNKVLFEVAVGENYFGEIARLKALRQVLTQLAKLYQVELSEDQVCLLAKSAHWDQSTLDVNTNLIRQTYQAMSGVLGGCNWLWVLPLGEDQAGSRERRIARNVSAVLREEAYLDKVMDPASGSFFLENLQSQIEHEIREGLQNLESFGGWLRMLTDGVIHSKVRTERERVQEQVLEKNKSKIGVNIFPASEKLKNDMAFEFFEEKIHQLQPTRATYLFELQTQTNP
ncbi:methylmalonyl-CoA mutase family protein [Algoriphagus taiwanensis]|uniref:Methylmalonyl-CoA mutase alpha/beta chain catalytic domain-containing protein n=1 Tax=Algoriphagus taiwanensis TaxID=1445656 RepID=A0ABQ6Q039_9BACT|nr:hypothetical protein Ataiwa_15090 [Algoriphagus taiwanensis]